MQRYDPFLKIIFNLNVTVRDVLLIASCSKTELFTYVTVYNCCYAV